MDLICKIEFFSDWNCGSGMSGGTDVDLKVIKTSSGLPYIPGKTIKGLLRDAAISLKAFSGEEKWSDFIDDCFGAPNKQGDEPTKWGKCFFSNGQLTEDLQQKIKDNSSFLYRKISSTAIEDTGIAKEHSLRKMEVVIPLTLFSSIESIPIEYKEYMIKCMSYVKRMGTGRNRGLGRCEFSEYNAGEGGNNG